MSYALGILPRAQRELGALPTETYQRLREAIFALAHEPRPQSSRKLTGREGWRLRVGDYRVLYDIDEAKQTISIVLWGLDEMCIAEGSLVSPTAPDRSRDANHVRAVLIKPGHVLGVPLHRLPGHRQPGR